MVKGISRQVIVVHAPEPKLFEQAIFILNDDAVASGSSAGHSWLRAAREKAASVSVWCGLGRRRCAADRACLGDYPVVLTCEGLPNVV